MRRLLGHIPLTAVLGIALATMVASPARAALYQMTVTVTDNTTSTTNTLTIDQGTANDVTDPTAPNAINTITLGGPGWTSFQNTTGLTLSGFNSSTNNPGSSNAVVSLGGTILVTGGTDSYTVTIQTSQTDFTSPLGATANLSVSESSTISNTTGNPGNGGSIPADSQSVRGWYDFNNGLNALSPPAPNTSYLLPATDNKSLMSPTVSSLIAPANPPFFSLTERIVVNITGNGSANANAKDVFGGTLTLTATSIPEPASIVMMLTGMLPLPLVIVGVLRRRRAAAG